MKLNLEVKKYLLSLADSKLLEFEKNLNMKNEYQKQIGVRIPYLRKYAKELSKKYDLKYLFDNIDEEYYEEVMLKGFIIGCYKDLDYNILEDYINLFVPKICDWAVCDTFCSSLKITKKYLKEMWKVINKYLKSKNEFEVRFALVMLLNYYLIDDYIDRVFKIINNVKLDKYYVKMANSWLISYCAIKYFDKTYIFLKEECNIDKWTYNKGIQKSIESYRLSDEEKDKLRLLRRRV